MIFTMANTVLENNSRSKLLMLIGLTVLFFAIYFFNLSGEKLFSYKSGLGIDGEYYGRMVRGLPGNLFDKTVEPYWYQKFLPAIVARVVLQLSGMPIDNPLIVKAYSLIDAISIAGSVFLYFAITRKLKYSIEKVTLGFVLVFFCFGLLKYAPYQPLLTDRVALFECFLLLYCYVINNWKLALLVAFLGLFTFPLVVWLTAMLVFSVKREETETAPKKMPVNVIAFVLSILPVGITAYDYFFSPDVFNKYANNGLASISWETTGAALLVILSAVFVCLFLFFGMVSVLKHVNISGMLSHVYWDRVVSFVALYVLLQLILHFFTGNPYGLSRTPFHFIENVSYQSLVFPAGFLVSHFMFFGSIVIVFLLGASGYLSKLSNRHLGVVCLFAVNLLLLVSTESREFIYLLPFAGFVILEGIDDKLAGSKVFFTTVLLINLAVSLFWFNINVPEIFEPITNKQAFPWQRFYMILGPWRSVQMNMLFGLVMVTSFGLVWYTMGKAKSIADARH